MRFASSSQRHDQSFISLKKNAKKFCLFLNAYLSDFEKIKEIITFNPLKK
jgi:hypothetical protein